MSLRARRSPRGWGRVVRIPSHRHAPRTQDHLPPPGHRQGAWRRGPQGVRPRRSPGGRARRPVGAVPVFPNERRPRPAGHRDNAPGPPASQQPPPRSPRSRCTRAHRARCRHEAPARNQASRALDRILRAPSPPPPASSPPARPPSRSRKPVAPCTTRIGAAGAGGHPPVYYRPPRPGR